MIHYVISLISSYFDGGIFQYSFVYIIPLAFLATVPMIILDLFRR